MDLRLLWKKRIKSPQAGQMSRTFMSNFCQPTKWGKTKEFSLPHHGIFAQRLHIINGDFWLICSSVHNCSSNIMVYTTSGELLHVICTRFYGIISPHYLTEGFDGQVIISADTGLFLMDILQDSVCCLQTGRFGDILKTSKERLYALKCDTKEIYILQGSNGEWTLMRKLTFHHSDISLTYNDSILLGKYSLCFASYNNSKIFLQDLKSQSLSMYEETVTNTGEKTSYNISLNAIYEENTSTPVTNSQTTNRVSGKAHKAKTSVSLLVVDSGNGCTHIVNKTGQVWEKSAGIVYPVHTLRDILIAGDATFWCLCHYGNKLVKFEC